MVRFDAVDGTQELVSQGGLLRDLAGIAVEPSGHILVSDSSSSSILRVDPRTGAQTTMSSDPLLPSPSTLAIDLDGAVLVANGSQILRVDPVSGAAMVHLSTNVGAAIGLTVVRLPEPGALLLALAALLAILALRQGRLQVISSSLPC